MISSYTKKMIVLLLALSFKTISAQDFAYVLPLTHDYNHYNSFMNAGTFVNSPPHRQFILGKIENDITFKKVNFSVTYAPIAHGSSFPKAVATLNCEIAIYDKNGQKIFFSKGQAAVTPSSVKGKSQIYTITLINSCELKRGVYYFCVKPISQNNYPVDLDVYEVTDHYSEIPEHKASFIGIETKNPEYPETIPIKNLPSTATANARMYETYYTSSSYYFIKIRLEE